MIHHSTVSLDYLLSLLNRGRDAGIDTHPGFQSAADIAHQWALLYQWRAKGYTYAPPCDNVTPDGRCAGHEKE